jgi:hypothetical protein
MSGPNQTPQPPNDRELEDFLAGRGQVHGVYHAAAQEKSPAAVDEAILKMAAQAAAEPVVPSVKVRPARRWPRSIAAAAVLVLSLAVFIQIRRDPVAERAALSSVAINETQTLATAQPVAPPPSAAVDQMQRAKSRADAEQTQRKRSEPKKEMAEADAVGALGAAAPAPKMAADMAPTAVQKSEAAAFAQAESESRNSAMRDVQKPASPAASMAAKSLRSAPAPMPAMTAVEGPSPVSEIDQQIDQWLRSCAADTALAALGRDERGMFKDAQQWRGLAITGLVEGSLLFAPSVGREAIVAQLNQLGPHAAECLVPTQSGGALRMRCGCLKP